MEKKRNHGSEMGAAIQGMLAHAKLYADAYKREFDSQVGNDGVLGDEGIASVLHGLNTLLEGPLGRHDGATLSRKILTAAKEMGFSEDEI